MPTPPNNAPFCRCITCGAPAGMPCKPECTAPVLPDDSEVFDPHASVPCIGLDAGCPVCLKLSELGKNSGATQRPPLSRFGDVPSRRWRAEAEAEAAENDPADPWVLRFLGALDEIDSLRELAASRVFFAVTSGTVDIPTLAILLRGIGTMKIPPNDSGARGWSELDERTRERWINYAAIVADSVRRLQSESKD
jgi:hypothetical protein